jgi:hypothetical protein
LPIATAAQAQISPAIAMKTRRRHTSRTNSSMLKAAGVRGDACRSADLA